MAKVFVIGGANVDVKGRCGATYVAGTSNPGNVMVTPGGVGRNITENLARLGVDVALIAAVGDDANGRLIAETTMAAGVDCSRLVRVAAPTGTYLVIVDEHGELVAAVNDMRAAEALTPDRLVPYADEFSRADLLIADCNSPVESLVWLAKLAQDAKVRLLMEPVSVPKARKVLGLPSVFVATPNRQQLHALARVENDAEAIAVLHARGIANLVVHCGADGALVSDGRKLTHLPAEAQVAVADVTGAGDAAVAGLALGLTEGLPIVEAARLGQRAAALKLMSHLSVAPGLSRDRLMR